MIAENPTALQILMNEDLFLTTEDRIQEEKLILQVLPEESAIIIEEKPAPQFTYIGKNLKKFLVLTAEGLHENHLKALENTLTRKQMSLDDVAVVDFSAYDKISFDQLNASFMPLKLVCFGLKPELLGLPQIGFNEVGTYSNCRILYTYSFSEMLGNKDKTKLFWEPMKVL